MRNFTSYLLQLYKLYKNNNKIYLLNSQSTFKLNENLLVLYFKEYYRYIVSLENELRDHVKIKIGNKNKKLNEIKEDDIPNLDLIPKKIKEIDANNPYYKNYLCHRQNAYCSIKEENTLFSILFMIQTH